MKKFLSILLVAVLAFALVACGNTTTTTETTDDAATEVTTDDAAETTEDAAETTETVEGAALNIAIVSSPSGVDDGSFNYDNYQGILSFIEENPASTVTPIREETGDSQAAVQQVADIAADYDVVVCCGFQFSGIGDIAADYPDTKFILIDAWPTIEGTELAADAPLENVYACYYAEQESGFFAGMAAAYSTKTGKVASVHGIAYPSNVNYQYGFECGVKYVNETEGTNVEVVEIASYAGTDVTGANVGGNYAGSFSDEATGKVIGEALIAEGVDVMFVAAGGSGNGVFTAAKEATDVYVIGCDADQFDDGVSGDKNVILTSALKVMHLTNYNQLNKIADGTFIGANETLTATGDYTGYVNAADRCQLSADVISKIDAAVDKVKNGLIVPAANFNGVTPETFVVE